MRKLLLVSALAAIAVAASPPPAQAESVMRLDSCVTTSNPTVPTIEARATHIVAAVPSKGADPLSFTSVGVLGMLMFAGTVKTITADKDTPFIGRTAQVQLNKLVADVYYFFNTRPAWQVAAAAVAPPVCNTATVTSQVKTTATTQMMLAGVLKSLTATDNLWTLTGGNLAIGSVRRYLLLWDGTSATTVVSVLASNDQVIANFANAAAALAACRFPSLPPLGTGIVGILSITNVTNVFTPGTTLLGAAGVTTAFIDGPDDSILQSAQVLP